MRFSTCRPGKTNENFRTIFGIRDEVGETYKYMRFRWDRFTGGAATQRWNVTVMWFLFSLFSVSSSRLQVAILDRFARLIAQTTCFVLYTCRFFTVGPIIFKFDGDVENLTLNATVTCKMHTYKNSRWRRPLSWLSKNGCFFLLLDQSLPNLMGITRILHGTQRFI